MGNDKDLHKFLNKLEGYSPEVYEDVKEIPTVGIGTNLQSPEVPKILEEKGIDKKDLENKKLKLDEETAKDILKKQLEEKKRYLETIQKRDFPEKELKENEVNALLSLGFNSPKLWGPNLRKKLKEGDDVGVAKEILLKSNKEKLPGIQKRRLEEAKLYSGENWDKVIESLSPDEIKQIQEQILSIKNPYTRQDILDAFPFLKPIAPSTRFRKFRNLK